MRDIHQDSRQLVVTVWFLAHEKSRNVDQEFEKKKILSSVRRFQRFVSQKLAEFIQCDIQYTLRRVLVAENARMYKGSVGGDVAVLFHHVRYTTYVRH